MILVRTQYSLNSDHQRHKWRQQNWWMSWQGCQDAQDKQQTQCQLTPRLKWKMHHHCWKFTKSECPDIWIRLPKHKWQKIMVQYGRSGCSFRARSAWSSFGRTIMGKAIWENPFKVRLGEGFKLGMLFWKPRRRTILVCECGRLKKGWEETEHRPIVESAHEKMLIWENRHHSLTVSIWVALKENVRYARILWIITEVCSNHGFPRRE